MHRFICIQGNHRGKEFHVDQGPSILGRSKECAIFIYDVKCSHRHCCVHAEGARVSIEDLKSCNGTRVNGRRIAGRTMLKDGDTVHVGDTILQLRSRDLGQLDHDDAVKELEKAEHEGFRHGVQSAKLEALRELHKHAHHPEPHHWWSFLEHLKGHRD
jgi:pSer/pThr/pTyr-binding forkhead associated (FHA) protein